MIQWLYNTFPLILEERERSACEWARNGTNYNAQGSRSEVRLIRAAALDHLRDAKAVKAVFSITLNKDVAVLRASNSAISSHEDR